MPDTITATQVWDWICHHIAYIIVILSLFIEITPIKFNPWSRIIKWFGDKLNHESNQKIDSLTTVVKNLEQEIDENEKDRIRWEILDFANSCRNGIKHTKDEFQHIITLNDKYKRLLSKTHDVNGVFDSEYAYIQELYTERQKKNDFL